MLGKLLQEPDGRGAWHLKGEVVEPYSAGIETHGLNSLAVQAVAECGVDISGHRSKRLDDLSGILFDTVVTVCGHAEEPRPVFPGGIKVVHVPFDDPPKLAEDAKSEEEALTFYRRARDEIRTFIERFPDEFRIE